MPINMLNFIEIILVNFPLQLFEFREKNEKTINLQRALNFWLLQLNLKFSLYIL